MTEPIKPLDDDDVDWWQQMFERDHNTPWEGPSVGRLLATIRALQSELRRPRCEHCGSDRIYSGPPDCPGCGAPNCCQTCCKTAELENRIDRLQSELRIKEGALRRIDTMAKSHDMHLPSLNAVTVAQITTSALSQPKEKP